MTASPNLARRSWVPAACEDYVQSHAAGTAAQSPAESVAWIERLARENRAIHEAACINLNPATNIMNPRAEALLSAGIGARPSLGYPGDKYEMGLEAIEKIEVICAELAAEVFGARFAEVRVASGALSNLYAFMALAKPGDRIVVPPPAVGGHVTHHKAGAAGLYGLEIHPAKPDSSGYTVDLDALRAQVRALRPKIVTIGGSLNLFAHPVKEIRAIADEVGAKVVFDAAHLSGLIAGKAWQQPLEEGAHVITMSTYKSLAGPAGGLIVTNDPEIAEALDRIAFPGLTANFDAGRVAALAVTLADWKAKGAAYAQAMKDTASALAAELIALGLPVHQAARGGTTSHQIALEAARFGGGQTASKRLRRANLLACGIGLPIAEVEGDLNGLRFGTPELVRTGMTPADMKTLATLIARALTGNEEPEAVASDVTALRGRFTGVHYVAE